MFATVSHLAGIVIEVNVIAVSVIEVNVISRRNLVNMVSRVRRLIPRVRGRTAAQNFLAAAAAPLDLAA
ncbi:hypothetical protein Poly21_26160 [Allorhodopirellula heiligendammensis]|uniref:Uncharacterized protein n=1 Tax=Allorhodopirellula heiligendammensis TaxID=2714739 RepID=A0A5C6BVF9_9BACT|nr:hypothetical protein Poly21_26160 [Allorhodopirellula heiligendammensis]